MMHENMQIRVFNTIDIKTMEKDEMQSKSQIYTRNTAC